MAGGLLLALSVAAAGCADNTRRADNKICTPFPTQPASNAADPAAVVPAPGGEQAAFDDCLHRWAYRLARSGDDAENVGKAVMAACSPVLSRWNQATVAAQPAGTPDSAVSLVTGKESNTPADRFDMGQAKALFYVVQARAGNCRAP
jgi:hypothetical protein